MSWLLSSSTSMLGTWIFRSNENVVHVKVLVAFAKGNSENSITKVKFPVDAIITDVCVSVTHNVLATPCLWNMDTRIYRTSSKLSNLAFTKTGSLSTDVKNTYCGMLLPTSILLQLSSNPNSRRTPNWWKSEKSNPLSLRFVHCPMEALSTYLQKAKYP